MHSFQRDLDERLDYSLALIYRNDLQLVRLSISETLCMEIFPSRNLRYESKSKLHFNCLTCTSNGSPLQGKGRLVALSAQAALGQFKKLWKNKSEDLKLWVCSLSCLPHTRCCFDVQKWRSNSSILEWQIKAPEEFALVVYHS